jgi:uncharacterized protein (DUF1501 family)
MIDRRGFLKSSLVGATMFSSMDRLAFASSGGDARLVMLILRGGMDGLAAAPAYGDSAYRKLRGTLALQSPRSTRGILNLDGFFGLHPNMKNLHAMYRQNEMLLGHAIATSYRDRSHFDGQKQLENGTDSPVGAHDGWLNRTLKYLPDASSEAIALAQNVPLILYGDAAVNSWSPSVLPEADSETIARIARMYAGDEFFSSQFESAMQTRAMADDLDDGGMMGKRSGARNQNIDVLIKAAGRFLGEEEGPRIAVLESSGWDTHANQGSDSGQLANKLSQLDTGLALLKRELGRAWKNTVVVVASEFGRTVAVNGSNGTDHGTANAVFLLGGAVNGGRVLSDWPGLAKSRLYEGRDLKSTLDIRSLFKSLLHDHLRISADALENTIFPGSSHARKVRDLIIG